MEKWIGVIIAAVFIIALGAIVFKYFHGTIADTADNISDDASDVISKTNGFINDNVVAPHHFQGIFDGFNSVMNTVGK